MRFYINQGHDIRWGIGDRGGQALAWMKVWEYGEDEPPWPEGFVPNTEYRHETTSVVEP